ncbi:DedA family protein [Guyparkeria sp.]|uniref:DedA family protein n=1 Tax=Guyparkeria sp. TaxID=2035736 RepID=UPI003970E06A
MASAKPSRADMVPMVAVMRWPIWLCFSATSQPHTGEVIDRFLQSALELSPLTIYVVLGVLCWAEAAFFLGFVTPGELAVVIGGILASRGQIEMGPLLGVVVSATVMGNTTGFYLGRRWGTRMLQWAPLQRFFGRSIRRGQDFMQRRGEWAIVLGRVSTPTRIIVPFLAGASEMPYRRFLLFDVPASVVWAITFITLGVVLGASWDVLKEVTGTAALLLLILFIVALIIRWVATRIAANRRRMEEVFLVTLRITGFSGVARTLTPGLHWLSRRLNPRLAQGLSLTLSFLALLVAAGAIGLVVSQTRAVAGLALIDFPVLEWMGDVRTEQAVAVARGGLLAFHWPGILVLAIPLIAFVSWRAGWGAALRIGVGVICAAGGAYFLDRFVLEGVVPDAEFPSVPVAAAAALLIQTTALTFRISNWGPAVAYAGVGAFVLFTVALGTLVAGWAAPSGIVLGLALGIGWATLVELVLGVHDSQPTPPAPEPESRSSSDP